MGIVQGLRRKRWGLSFTYWGHVGDYLPFAGDMSGIILQVQGTSSELENCYFESGVGTVNKQQFEMV